MVRSDEKLYTVTGRQPILGKWVHLAGVLSPEKELQLYVDGEPVATKTDVPFITKDPIQIMEIGMDGISPVGEYASPSLHRSY